MKHRFYSTLPGTILVLCLASMSARAEEQHIFTAIRQRDATRVQGLLHKFPEVHTARTAHGQTPLHLASQLGDLKIATQLLEAGADVRAVDDWGNTALHHAARRGREYVIGLLIAHGADVAAVNHDGQTPLSVLADQGPMAPELDQLLATAAKVLLAHGAQVCVADDHAHTALDYAMFRGHTRLIAVLREACEQDCCQAAGDHNLTPARRQTTGLFYHTHAQIGEYLGELEIAYPDLCRREELGTSVQGRVIWALHLSDNVDDEQDEPELKYISSMHGDEIVGVEMCLYLMDYLTAYYGSDPRVTDIVDSIDLWIVPLMNPDGYEHVPRTRYNANGVDLNRDFPNLGEPNSTAGRARETAVIMDWSAAHSFVLAANFHGGSLVVNYPFDNYDSGSNISPDDDVFIWISEQYSQHNLPMWNSPYFYHGVTNGADWYVVHGSMQDWSYHFMGCNEVTIEIGENKQPPAEQLPQYWEDNREAMLSYVETVLMGVHGLVADIDSGLPLAATVTVGGRNHAIATDADIGDYHRMLLPGTYELQFEAEGYDPLVIPDVQVVAGNANVLDVSLGPPAQLLTPNGGEQLTVGVPATIQWNGQEDAQFHLQYTLNADEADTLIDGFEDGVLDHSYQSGGDASWFVTASTSYVGEYSARAGDIGDQQISWMTTTANGGDVSFYYQVSSEAGYDFFNFYVDDVQELHESGLGQGWQFYSTTLSAGEHTLKWEYAKDINTSHGSDTVWIDELQLVEDLTVWTDIIPLTNPGAASYEWTPSDESAAAKVRVRAYYGEGSYGLWDQSDDVFSILAGSCMADIDDSGVVDVIDLLELLGAWGACTGCAADINGDGAVDVIDLLSLLAAWGACA